MAIWKWNVGANGGTDNSGGNSWGDGSAEDFEFLGSGRQGDGWNYVSSSRY